MQNHDEAVVECIAHRSLENRAVVTGFTAYNETVEFRKMGLVRSMSGNILAALIVPPHEYRIWECSAGSSLHETENSEIKEVGFII